MIVDCSTCVVRGRGCDGCVVTVLFGGVPGVRCAVARVGP